MVTPGMVYMVDHPIWGRRPVVVVSREPLNRGSGVLVVPFTTTRLTERRELRNCVPFAAYEFGLTRDCVAQCENVLTIDTALLVGSPLGTLDDHRMRDVIRAIGYVIQAECEPD